MPSRRKLVAAAGVLMLCGASCAQASTTTTTTLTLDDVFSYTDTVTAGNPATIKNDLKSAYTVTLDTPISSQSFFTATPASSSGIACGTGKTQHSCGNGYDTARETLNVNLTFTLLQTVTVTTSNPKSTKTTTTTLGTGSLNAVGYYVANYDGTATYNGAPCTTSPGTQTDCIVWSGEAPGATSITYEVPISGTSDAVLVTLYNAQDWAITPTISLELVPYSTTHEGATPLPAALPLFAGGLGAIAAFGWRRKRKTLRASA